MKKLLIAVIGILLMAGSYFLGKHETTSSTILQNQEHPLFKTSVSDVAEIAAADEKPVTKNNLPLPPANSPLNEIYNGLQQRADAGDAKAACRLAIELVRCQQALNMNKFMSVDPDSVVEEADQSLKPVDKLKMANSIDEHRLTIMEKANSCNKISVSQLKQTFRYLKQAANASQPDAMVAYIDGRGLEGEGGFALVRSTDFDAWRRDALPIAERALQQGVPEAIFLFDNAYSNDHSLFSGLIVDDTLNAETMRLLRLRVEGKSPTVSTTLIASDYQRALLKSDDMFRNYFHGQVRPKINFMKRLASYASTQKEDFAPCE
jgi:hypothetical protein